MTAAGPPGASRATPGPDGSPGPGPGRANPDRGAAAAPVAVIGASLHLPGADLAVACPALAAALGGLAALDPARAGLAARGEPIAGSAGPACPPERAHELLGRKGLLGKDAATRLALCAVHQALRLPPRATRASGPPDPEVAVVASSNLGNVSSVLDVVRAVRVGGRREVSPLAAPNASSNVVASAVAIWFRFGGPGLMVCSGATSGLDAVALGMLMLQAGRARHVVVVGAEPADEAAVALSGLRATGPAPLRAGAACVILTRAASAPGAPRVGPVRGSAARPTDPVSLRLLTAPVPAVAATSPASPPGKGIDLAGACGDLYGATGVALVALAAGITASGQAGAVRVTDGDDADGWRTVDVLDGSGKVLA